MGKDRFSQCAKEIFARGEDYRSKLGLARNFVTGFSRAALGTAEPAIEPMQLRLM